jgi:hypothetical protein
MSHNETKPLSFNEFTKEKKDPFNSLGPAKWENVQFNVPAKKNSGRETVESLKAEIDEIKLALIDIITKLPRDPSLENFAEAFAADSVGACAAAANSFVPFAGTGIRVAKAGVNAVCRRVLPRKTYEQELTSLKKFLLDAFQRGQGNTNGLNPGQYSAVNKFLDISEPSLEDIRQLKLDIFNAKANAQSHWKNLILRKLVPFSRFETKKGGTKKRKFGKLAKTIRQQRRL